MSCASKATNTIQLYRQYFCRAYELRAISTLVCCAREGTPMSASRALCRAPRTYLQSKEPCMRSRISASGDFDCEFASFSVPLVPTWHRPLLGGRGHFLFFHVGHLQELLKRIIQSSRAWLCETAEIRHRTNFRCSSDRYCASSS